MAYKVLFMGTPEFGVPTLKALIDSKDFDVDLVITQPDRPSGRKMKLTPSPIKSFAQENGIRVLSPEKVSTPEIIELIKEKNFDVAVVLAFGQLLKQNLLDVLPNKFINIHASLLPRWRGAAPIQRAIMEGDKETGVSLQIMELSLDTGPVIFEEKIEIGENENSLELANRLSEISANTVTKALLGYLKKEVTPKPQEESLSTYAKKIDKSEGLIKWSQLSAQEIHNNVRGLKWGPGAFTFLEEKRVKVFNTHVSDFNDLQPGHIKIEDEFILVGCKKGSLGISNLQPQNSKPLKISDFVNGYNLTEKCCFK